METKWNFKLLLEKEFEEERKSTEKAYWEFIKKWKENLSYTKNPRILQEALQEFEKLHEEHADGNNEHYYFWLQTQLDEANPGLKAKLNKIEEFLINLENKINFFIINLSKIPKEDQKDFLDSDLLKNYKHFLEKIFENSKYLLNEKEEEIMSLKSLSSYGLWVNMISGFLSKEEGIVLDENLKETTKSFSEIRDLQDNSNKKIREKASEIFNKIVEKHEDAAENEINAVLENRKANDQIRGYERPDKSRHSEDDIDTDSVETLIKTISKKGFEISNNFYNLKSKLTGIKKFNYSERNIEYGKISKNFDYETSIKLVKKVFSNLDEEFVEIFEKFLNNGQIDAFPKKGKRSGAFCVIHSKNQPIYVMLNHTNSLRNITTIAHEMGHAINNEFMKKNLNSLNIGNPKSIAEVASTFMEDFVLQELLKDCTKEEKLILLVQKLQEDIQTISRQVACYNFEFELHKEFREKGYLSKEEIGKIFKKNMKNYLGDSFIEGKDMENGWIYWPHIREYFYVYSYASGLLISKAMQKKFKENPKFIKEIKTFLSSGTSKSPKEIFNEIGIDISKKEFWEKGLEEIQDLLNETEKLAKELKKI